jgi:hypothetical protein
MWPAMFQPSKRGAKYKAARRAGRADWFLIAARLYREHRRNSFQSSSGPFREPGQQRNRFLSPLKLMEEQHAAVAALRCCSPGLGISMPPRGMWASAGVPDGLQLGERSNSFQTQDSSCDFSSSAGKLYVVVELGKYSFQFVAVALTCVRLRCSGTRRPANGR